MSSAARQRLLRFDNANQPTLGGVLDNLVDPIQPPPADDTEAETTFRALADQVRPQFVSDDDPWATSPYAWIKHLPSVSRGRAGTTIVERWARTAGFDITRHKGPGHDLIAGAQRLEVKLSTLWNSGEYTFQSIRDDGYDTLVLLGISPHDAHLWIVPRTTGLANLDRTSQTGGWLTIDAHAPGPWLTEHGGSLAAAHAVAQHQWPARGAH